jgi:hypothetical protein
VNSGFANLEKEWTTVLWLLEKLKPRLKETLLLHRIIQRFQNATSNQSQSSAYRTAQLLTILLVNLLISIQTLNS